MTGKQTSKSQRARADVRKRLRRVVDRNTEVAERIHRAVAGFPLDVLEQVERLEKPVARLRKLQDRSIGATYDLVRGIEREVIALVDAPRGARRRGTATKKARTVKRPQHTREAADRQDREVAESAARAS